MGRAVADSACLHFVCGGSHHSARALAAQAAAWHLCASAEPITSFSDMVRWLCPWQTCGARGGVAVAHSQAIHELKLYLCVQQPPPPTAIASGRAHHRSRIEAKTTASTPPDPRNSGGCRATTSLPTHPSHTQHTCGSRPYLATLRTAAAAADTNNSSGCRDTPVRLARIAVAAAAAAVPPNTRAAAATCPHLVTMTTTAAAADALPPSYSGGCRQRQ